MSTPEEEEVKSDRSTEDAGLPGEENRQSEWPDFYPDRDFPKDKYQF